MAKKEKEVAIQVRDLHKSFRLPKEHSSELKQHVINFFRGVKGYKELHVLKGVSFTVEKGDFFGIVGRNGSGKSTLLKLLAGIYTPDKGSIQVNGSIVPFIELGVGFNPELTGRENVYLNGAMLGFSNEEVDKMYDEIVDFAELHEFMGQKLKNYSSGMQVRLAFSIAIKAQGDILILDEVLAVGDEAFQRKCFNYFAELRRDKKTVILVTHSMDSVQQFCTKALMIEKGEVVKLGNTAKVAQHYRELFMPKEQKMNKKENGRLANKKSQISANLKKSDSRKELSFNISIMPMEDMPDAVVAISITRDTGEIVYRWASNEKLSKNLLVKRNKKMSIELEIQNIFPNGIFSLNVSLRSKDMTTFYFSADNLLRFEIVNKTSYAADAFWKPKEQVKVVC